MLKQPKKKKQTTYTFSSLADHCYFICSKLIKEERLCLYFLIPHKHFLSVNGEPGLFSSLQAGAADFDRCNGLLLKDQRSHQQRGGPRSCPAQLNKEAEDTSSAPCKPVTV